MKTTIDNIQDIGNMHLTSEIDGVKNLFFKDKLLTFEGVDYRVNNVLENYLYLLNGLLSRESDNGDKKIPLFELEKLLKNNFTDRVAYLDPNDNIRVANCFAWKNTQIHRTVEKIILPNGDLIMPTETNIGGNIIDPIGWSSKSPAPSGGYDKNGEHSGYGLLGKIPELRPKSSEFDKEIYEELMNTKVLIENLGIAIEAGRDEIAVMPVYKIHGGDDIISEFSEEKSNLNFPTGKHYGINS